MKRYLGILCSFILALSLTACGADFDGSLSKNDHELVMDYKVLDTTYSQDLVAEAGDTIHVELVVEDGQLSYKVQKGDEEPVAESEGKR